MSDLENNVKNEAKQNAVVTMEPAIQRVVVNDAGSYSNLMDTGRFEHAWRVAELFSRSTLVPAHFQGNKSNCFIAVNMAMRWELDPFMVMQNLYVVYGRPGIEAKLAIALANMRGPFVGRIGYRLDGAGKTRSCTAFATLKETGEIVEACVDWDMADKMGWLSKKDSMWLKMPDQMLKYRSAMFLIKTVCPEVILGLSSREELDDLPTCAVGVAKNEILDQLEASAPAPTKPATTTMNIESEVKTHGAATPEPTSSPSTRYQAFLDALKEAETIQDCQGLETQAKEDPAISAADRTAFAMDVQGRIDAIRGTRGKKSNGLFDKGDVPS